MKPATTTIEPTKRQAEAMNAICGHIAEKGYPPTFREIGVAMGIRSPNGVQAHLKALRAKGLIECDKGVARGIRVLVKW